MTNPSPTTASLSQRLDIFLTSLSHFPWKNTAQTLLERFREDRLGLTASSLTFTTTIALILTIDRTLNNIWRVRKPRPLGQRVLVYWAAVTLGPLLLAVSLTVTSYAVSTSKGLVGSLPGGVQLLLDSLQFVLLAWGMA